MAADEQNIAFNNAKWFSNELGDFSAEDQTRLIHAVDENNYGLFQKVVLDNSRNDFLRLWQGGTDRKEFVNQGINIPIAQSRKTGLPEKDSPKKETHEQHGRHYDDPEIDKNKAEAEPLSEKDKAKDEKIAGEDIEKSLNDEAEIEKQQNTTSEEKTKHEELSLPEETRTEGSTAEITIVPQATIPVAPKAIMVSAVKEKAPSYDEAKRHQLLKKAEEALRKDWEEKYKQSEAEAFQEERSKLIDFLTKTNTGSVSRSSKEIEEEATRLARAQRNDVERQMVGPDGRMVEKDFDRSVNAKFKEKFGRDWHKGREEWYQVETTDRYGHFVQRPAKRIFTAGVYLSSNEIEEKARQMYPEDFLKPEAEESSTAPEVDSGTSTVITQETPSQPKGASPEETSTMGSSGENTQITVSPTMTTTMPESPTQTAKGRQKLAIASLQAMGATSPFIIQGGSSDDSHDYSQNSPSGQATPNQTPSNLSYLNRRGKRAKRRHGAGGFAKSIGKNAAKKGAKRTAAWGVSWLMANPEVLVVIGIGLGLLAAFFFILFSIISACKVNQLSLLTNPGAVALASIGHLSGLCEAPYQAQYPPNPPGITIENLGPYRIVNGDKITYKIKVSYDPSFPGAPPLDGLFLYDVPLFENGYISSTGTSPRKTDSSGKTYYEWRLSDFASQPNPTAKIELLFSLVVAPFVDDYLGVNVVYVGTEYKPIQMAFASGVGGGGGSSGPTSSTGPDVKACDARDPSDVWHGADCAPTDDTCDGRWRDQMYGNDRIVGTKNVVEGHIRDGDLTGANGDGYNFGDPLCSFKQFKVDLVIDDLVKSGIENEERGAFWKDIAYCEGTPNSFGNQQPEDGDPMGPAGYFQMNIGSPVVFKPTANGNYNRGDVPWQRQIQNAILFNNGRKKLTPGQDFTYWQAARCLCAYDGYKNKNYCDDIYARGVVVPKGSCNTKCQERGSEGPAL